MMIESSGDTEFGVEREWYYGNVEKERIGPKSFHEVRMINVNQNTHIINFQKSHVLLIKLVDLTSSSSRMPQSI